MIHDELVSPAALPLGPSDARLFDSPVRASSRDFTGHTPAQRAVETVATASEAASVSAWDLRTDPIDEPVANQQAEETAGQANEEPAQQQSRLDMVGATACATEGATAGRLHAAESVLQSRAAESAARPTAQLVEQPASQLILERQLRSQLIVEPAARPALQRRERRDWRKASPATQAFDEGILAQVQTPAEPSGLARRTARTVLETLWKPTLDLTAS